MSYEFARHLGFGLEGVFQHDQLSTNNISVNGARFLPTFSLVLVFDLLLQQFYNLIPASCQICSLSQPTYPNFKVLQIHYATIRKGSFYGLRCFQAATCIIYFVPL